MSDKVKILIVFMQPEGWGMGDFARAKEDDFVLGQDSKKVFINLGQH